MSITKIRGSVRVHLDSDETIQGVLIRKRRRWIVLGAASRIGDKDVPLKGDTWIPMHRVRFMQRV